MDDPTRPRDRTNPPPDAPPPEVDRSHALSPLPDEDPRPPLDVDQREGHVPSPDVLAMPAHGADQDDAGLPAGELQEQVEETLPRPAEPAAPAPPPADALDDQIDDTLPEPEPSARPAATTPDDMDAETAFGIDRPASDATGPAATADPLTSLSLDAPEPELTDEQTVPVDDAPIIVRTASGERTDASFGHDRTEANPGDIGSTRCPVCGRETDALRFCGHCGAPLTQRPREAGAGGLVGQISGQAATLLEPLLAWTRHAAVRATLGGGAALVLLALLANSGGLALIVGAALLPIILVYAFTELDVYEPEPPLLIAGVGLAGALVGAILGWIGSWVVERNWFATGILNYGAAGFGGRFAADAGAPPFAVWAIDGVLLPLVAILAIVGIPTTLRQSMALRNEIMDGLTLGAAVGGGVALGSAMVFAAPMVGGGGPANDASTWTLTTIGLTIVRPLIWTLGGAMLGAAAWRYMRTPSIAGILLPVAAGVGGLVLHPFVALQLAPAGLWAEALWGVAVAAAVGAAFTHTLHQAIAHDRRILGSDDTRQICPHCHRVTPTGAFCAHCGAALGDRPT